MKILALGASRNIGYHASLRLLERGDTVTFLLRSTEAFEKDPAIIPHIGTGKARLIQGDAMKEEDVKRAWASACLATSGSSPSDEGQVDLLLITIGESIIPDLKFSQHINPNRYISDRSYEGFHSSFQRYPHQSCGYLYPDNPQCTFDLPRIHYTSHRCSEHHWAWE